MKITLCGSIYFIDEMNEWKSKLEKAGHQVKMPPTQIQLSNGESYTAKDFYQKRKMADRSDKLIWDRKRKAIIDHFEKIEWSEAILVVNEDKNGIPGYIGPNTFLEIGIAFYLGKKLYCTKNLPKMENAEELIVMDIQLLDGDSEKLL